MYNEEFMRRAVELAVKGEGFTSPNPLVGAVIVKDGKIIGEGFHERYGDLHAEANALKNASESVDGAEMYVTLEPCAHYGKQPPCAETIAKTGIKKVYIAVTDPNPKVSGKGIAILNNAGIETKVTEYKGARNILQPFLKHITQKIPYVAVKTAMTLDGKTATKEGDSRWVTGEPARKRVHELRRRYDGIMVGMGTVLCDDPMLDCRLEEKPRDPVKIILDTHLRLPVNAKLLKKGRTIVLTGQKEGAGELKRSGAEVLECKLKNGRIDLNDALKKLYDAGVYSVLCEGGSEVNFSLLEEGLVDKLYTFIAPKLLGGANAKTTFGGRGFEKMCDAVKLEVDGISKFGSDILIESYVNRY